jgi:hypothetical protein
MDRPCCKGYMRTTEIRSRTRRIKLIIKLLFSRRFCRIKVLLFITFLPFLLSSSFLLLCISSALPSMTKYSQAGSASRLFGLAALWFECVEVSSTVTVILPQQIFPSSTYSLSGAFIHVYILRFKAGKKQNI